MLNLVLFLTFVGALLLMVYSYLQNKGLDTGGPLSEEKQGGVPETDEFGPAATLNLLGDRQKSFYRKWKEAWERGNPKPLNGDIDYLYIYLKELVEDEDYGQLQETLPLLTEEYGDNNMEGIFQRLLTDTHVIQRDFQKAAQHSIHCCMKYYSYPNFLVFSFTGPTDEYLSLKLSEGNPVRGNDIILCDRNSGSRLTDAVKDHIPSVAQEIENILEKKVKDPGRILEDWSEVAERERSSENDEGKRGYYAFERLRRHARLIETPVYNFNRSDEVKNFVSDITRRAENKVREALGIPKVGEGWISETELYHLVDNILDDYRVMHHATPEWLTPQHLDVFIPQADLAIEYQGRQHYEPVEFFGGQDGFEETQERDQKKRELCQENDVELIEWRYDDDISEEEVKKRITSYV